MNIRRLQENGSGGQGKEIEVQALLFLAGTLMDIYSLGQASSTHLSAPSGLPATLQVEVG